MAKKLEQSAAELEMLNRALQLRKDAQRYAPYENAYIADVMDTSDDRHRTASRGAADAAQAMAKRPASYDSNGNGLFDAAMKRAKGLSRVLASGDQAVEQQGLRDRMSLVDFGRQRAAGGASSSAASATLAQRLAAGNARNSAYVNSAKSNFWGTIGGAGLNFALDYFN